MTDDPRDRFLVAVKLGLRCGLLTRRRVVRELTAHLDDTVSELEACGMAERAAVQEALRRLGDVDTITASFREMRPQTARRSAVRRLRSPAWVAVGAMSLVTAWAAELPQASGAKPRTAAFPAVHSRHAAAPRGDANTFSIRARQRIRR